MPYQKGCSKLRKINEENVDDIIQNLIERTKGKYITQGVSFNKTCPRQIALLRNSLLASASFSGLAKEMLALRFNKTTGGILVPQEYVDQNLYVNDDESLIIENASNWV